MLMQYLKLLRIHQWHKNGFVLLGFFLLGDYKNLALLALSFTAAFSFCLASSAIYIINDYHDAASDRNHPLKKSRPLAAQTVNPKSALALSALLLMASLVTAYGVSRAGVLIISIYVINHLVYTFFSKKLVVVDIFQIAFGFMLRIFDRTVGVGIFISEWMVITGFMVSLLIGFSKRFVELAHSRNPHAQRHVLQFYSTDILKSFVLVMAAATIVTYALYTLSARSARIHQTTNLIYTTPIVIFGILRYVLLLFTTRTQDDPANLFWRDKQLLGAMILWAAVYAIMIV